MIYSSPEQTEFINGELRINYVSGCAYLKEKELHLTPIEYKLLVLLSKNVGKVLTHTYLTRENMGKFMGERRGIFAGFHGSASQED